MTLLSLLLGLALTSVNPVENGKPVVKPVENTVNKTLLLQLVNDARKKGCSCGGKWQAPVPPLAWNDLLEKAALNHSADMKAKTYFSHTSPNGNKAASRLDAVGYNWRSYAENIAQGYETEKEVVAGWLKSEGHCKNLMNAAYKEMGVAKSGTYWTQVFGTKN